MKDTEDPETHASIVATAEMMNAVNGKSRLGCTVALKAYGNAIVPQVMYEIFRAIEQVEKQLTI